MRYLSALWFLAGLSLGSHGALELLGSEVEKVGRFWVVPLLPVVTLAAAFGAISLAVALWKESPKVGLLGRVMTVPVFAAAIWLTIGGLTMLSIGFTLDSALWLAGGIAAFWFCVVNYRAARKMSEE